MQVVTEEDPPRAQGPHPSREVVVARHDVPRAGMLAQEIGGGLDLVREGRQGSREVAVHAQRIPPVRQRQRQGEERHRSAPRRLRPGPVQPADGAAGQVPRSDAGGGGGQEAQPVEDLVLLPRELERAQAEVAEPDQERARHLGRPQPPQAVAAPMGHGRPPQAQHEEPAAARGGLQQVRRHGADRHHGARDQEGIAEEQHCEVGADDQGVDAEDHQHVGDLAARLGAAVEQGPRGEDQEPDRHVGHVQDEGPAHQVQEESGGDPAPRPADPDEGTQHEGEEDQAEGVVGLEQEGQAPGHAIDPGEVQRRRGQEGGKARDERALPRRPGGVGPAGRGVRTRSQAEVEREREAHGHDQRKERIERQHAVGAAAGDRGHQQPPERLEVELSDLPRPQRRVAHGHHLAQGHVADAVAAGAQRVEPLQRVVRHRPRVAVGQERAQERPPRLLDLQEERDPGQAQDGIGQVGRGQEGRHVEARDVQAQHVRRRHRPVIVLQERGSPGGARRPATMAGLCPLETGPRPRCAA